MPPTAPIPEPRPSATVVLLRPAAGAPGIEAYLQRRAVAVVGGGLWVFPGGTIDAGDRLHDLDEHWAGPDPSWWAARLGTTAGQARGAVAAACRETLEEAGVLLADRPVAPEPVAAARAALLAGAPLAEAMAGLDARIDTGLLRAWSHWVTPEAEPRRWSTHFFLAALPAGVAIAPHPSEADQERWVAPGDAADDASLPMLPPTRYTLRELAAFETVDEALAAALDRPIQPILPRVEGDTVVLPWGARMPLRLPSREGA